MADSTIATRPDQPRRRSVALGLFILLQLGFLITHNLFALLQEVRNEMSADARAMVRQVAPDWPEKQGHVWNLMEGSAQLTNRWSQLTLQLQTWSLFAPGIGKECVFPALLLSDEPPPDAPVTPGESPVHYEVRGKVVLSDNEPLDMNGYFRFGNFRLRRFENNFVLYLRPWEQETPRETVERLRQRIKDQVSESAEMLAEYLRFRLRQKGEAPPRQVILLMRRYSLVGPDGGAKFLEGPFTMPVARWLPHADRGADPPKLDYFNPVTQRFEPLQP